MNEHAPEATATSGGHEQHKERWAVPDRNMRRRLVSLGRADGRRGLPAPDGGCPPALAGLAAQAEQMLEHIGRELSAQLREADAELARAKQRLQAADDQLSARTATLTEAEHAGEEADPRRLDGLRALAHRAEQQRQRRQEEVVVAVSDRDAILADFRHRAWHAIRFFENAAQLYADANVRARRAPRWLARWLPGLGAAASQLPATEQFALDVRVPKWLEATFADTATPESDSPHGVPQPNDGAVSLVADPPVDRRSRSEQADA